MTHEQALERVRKLLALAESDNPHEAALAMGRAQALMESHRISMAALDDSPDDEPIQLWDDPLDSRVRATWKKRLGMTLCTANGCAIYNSSGALVITGRASNVQTVRYLYRYCVRAIDRLTRSNGAGNGRTWMNNYRLGCVDAIAKAIRAEREAEQSRMRQTVSNDESALIRVDAAIARVAAEYREADQYMHSKVQLGRGGSSSARYDGSARAAGRSDGAGIYSGGSRGAVGPGVRRIGA